MKALRKLFSVLLVLIMIPLLLGQMAGQTVRSLMDTPEFTKETIQQSGLYAQFQTLVTDQVKGGLEGSEFPIPITPEEIQGFVGTVLPADRLQALVETSIDGLYEWFWSGASRPEIILDLSETRKALPEALLPIVIAKVEALPVCTISQLADMAVNYKGGIPPCKSPSADFNRTMVEKAVPLDQIEQVIPERVDVATELEKRFGTEFWAEAVTRMWEVRRILELIPLGWAVIGVLTLLLGLLNLDRWFTPFAWIAAPLIISGVIMMNGGPVGAALVLPRIGDAIPSGNPMGSTALSAARFAVESIAARLHNLGLLVALCGLGSLIAYVAATLIFRPPANPANPSHRAVS